MPHYSIKLDLRHRTLTVAMRGGWNLAIAQAYVAELARVAGQLRTQPGPSRWLIDTTQCAVQPREAAAYMETMLPHIIPPQTRIAIVTTTALIAIQARRVAPDDAHAVFSSVEAARAWLAAGPAD